VRGPAGTPATLQLAAAAPQMAEALRAVVASPGWATLPADVRMLVTGALAATA
jgi:hypothetical protein